MGVPFHFTGLQTLKIKETDRIKALKTELAKLGYHLEDINNCELKWDGKKEALTSHPSPLTSVAIDTYEDHRMALAFAPLAFKMPISINNPQVVTKSYPSYWKDLESSEFIIQSL
jgi:3-phosphoshikimate 1-carboxyvinyltransferase